MAGGVRSWLTWMLMEKQRFPEVSVTVARMTWKPLGIERVLKDPDQFPNPVKPMTQDLPPSMPAWIVEMATLSNAVPATVIWPKIVAPSRGAVMVTEGG